LLVVFFRRATPVARERAPTGSGACPRRRYPIRPGKICRFTEYELLPVWGKNAGSEQKIPLDKKILNYKLLIKSCLQIMEIFLDCLVSELLCLPQTCAQANDSSSYP
jgi:hypothetical protein